MISAKLRQAIQKIPLAGEFALVLSICFGYSIVTSVRSLALDPYGSLLDGRALARFMFLQIARLFFAGLILKLRRWELQRLGFRFSWLAVLAGVPVWLGYLGLYAAAFFLALLFYPMALDPHGSVILEGSSAILLLAILLNSVFEEAAVTGYIVSSLSPYGLVISIGTSALIRVAYHLYYGSAAFVYILPMGLLFPLIYWKWRNLWPLITAHSLQNIWIILIVPYLDAHRSI